MRLFIAIELSDEIREALAEIQSHLKYAGADIKWVNKDNIHLTMKFLGEVPEEKYIKVKAALDGIAGSVSPFDISIKDIGAFPKIEHPRVIWVGLDKGAIESKDLAGRIDDALSKLGFQEEPRPFAAHLTVGRVRSPKNKAALKEKISGCAVPDIKAHHVTSVILFQSTLTPKGPIYTKLHEAKLSRYGILSAE